MECKNHYAKEVSVCGIKMNLMLMELHQDALCVENTIAIAWWRLEFESEQEQGYIELKCIECGKEWLETDYYLDVYTGKDTYCEDCAPIIRVVCSECGREEEVICYEKSQEELFQSPKYRWESCIYKDINF